MSVIVSCFNCLLLLCQSISSRVAYLHIKRWGWGWTQRQAHARTNYAFIFYSVPLRCRCQRCKGRSQRRCHRRRQHVLLLLFVFCLCGASPLPQLPLPCLFFFLSLFVACAYCIFIYIRIFNDIRTLCACVCTYKILHWFSQRNKHDKQLTHTHNQKPNSFLAHSSTAHTYTHKLVLNI